MIVMMMLIALGEILMMLVTLVTLVTNYIIPSLDPLRIISTTEKWLIRLIILRAVQMISHLCGL